jgi:ribosomal protein S6--L-glutamate ligase
MNIIVLSRNPALYSTQSILRAGRERGHFMRVLDHAFCDLVIESGQLKMYYDGYPLEGIHAVIPRIGASVTETGAYVIRQFEGMGIYSSLPSESLLKARDKLTALQVLAAANIPVPKTIFTNYTEDLEGFLGMIDEYPMIIKWIKSTHGIGVVKAETKSNAVSILEAFLRMKGKSIAQRFIREAEGVDIRAFVVGNKVVAAMRRTAQKGEFRSNLHRGGSSEVIKLTPDEIKISLKAAEVLGLNIAGVDFLRSGNGPLVIEVNASPGLEGIETATNIRVARHIITYVERNAKYL